LVRWSGCVCSLCGLPSKFSPPPMLLNILFLYMNVRLWCRKAVSLQEVGSCPPLDFHLNFESITIHFPRRYPAILLTFTNAALLAKAQRLLFVLPHFLLLNVRNREEKIFQTSKRDMVEYKKRLYFQCTLMEKFGIAEKYIFCTQYAMGSSCC